MTMLQEFRMFEGSSEADHGRRSLTHSKYPLINQIFDYTWLFTTLRVDQCS